MGRTQSPIRPLLEAYQVATGVFEAVAACADDPDLHHVYSLGRPKPSCVGEGNPTFKRNRPTRGIIVSCRWSVGVEAEYDDAPIKPPDVRRPSNMSARSSPLGVIYLVISTSAHMPLSKWPGTLQIRTYFPGLSATVRIPDVPGSSSDTSPLSPALSSSTRFSASR